MNGMRPDAVMVIAPVLAIAALIFLLFLAGCTTTPAPAPVTTIPTTVPTPVPTTAVVTPPTVSPDVAADKEFADAADLCYNQTPVITNLSTRLTFATCMQGIPLPPGNCAQNYRYYVLKATNEDASSAGYARETDTNNLARAAYLRGEGYNEVSLQYVPCGNATLIRTSFYK